MEKTVLSKSLSKKFKKSQRNLGSYKTSCNTLKPEAKTSPNSLFVGKNVLQIKLPLRARSLVVSDLRSETKGSRFESGC